MRAPRPRNHRGRRFRGLAVVSLVGSRDRRRRSCADDKQDTSSSGTTDTTEAMAQNAGTPTGPGCSAVPEDGKGRFAGMAQDPAATAASNNPVLSTLVAAVTAADLGDTLNGAGPFTIFAPTNDAFNKIPKADLDAVLADKATLTKILTLHVIAGEKLSSDQLAEQGTATTVEGEDITFAKEGDTLMVNGQASVVCADVPVANATVHIIDSVLMPGGAERVGCDGALGLGVLGGPRRRCRLVHRHGAGPRRHRGVEQPGAVDPGRRGHGRRPR